LSCSSAAAASADDDNDMLRTGCARLRQSSYDSRRWDPQALAVDEREGNAMQCQGALLAGLLFVGACRKKSKKVASASTRVSFRPSWS
jgi:hypothetical protein